MSSVATIIRNDKEDIEFLLMEIEEQQKQIKDLLQNIKVIQGV